MVSQKSYSLLTWAIRPLAFLLTLLSICWALEVPWKIGLVLYNEQYLALILGIAICLAMLEAATSRTAAMRGVLILLAAVGLGVGCYLALEYGNLLLDIVRKPVGGLIVCAIVVLLTIEAVRRSGGAALFSVIVIFVGYALLRNRVPGQFGGVAVDPARLVGYLALDSNAILGSPLMVAATVVIAFIFMGQCLLYGGGGAFFRDISMVLFGRLRGGSGKIAIFSSMLFGLISGSAVGNVVSTGVMTIKIMKAGGFRPAQAAAIEAVASTGGQILPPVLGATAFLIAEFIRVPYSAIAVAAIVPALLYFFSLYLSVDFTAAKAGILPLKADEIPNGWAVMKDGWHVPFSLSLLLIGLFAFNLSPEYAAMLASAGFIVNGVLFGYGGKKMRFAELGQSIVDTGMSAVTIVLICAAAGIVIGVLSLTGASFTLSLALTNLAGNSVGLLLVITAVASIILGMGMPTVGVYVLLATLIGPSLEQTGLPLIGLHLFLMYFGMLSMITPPVGVAAFVAAGIAGGPMMRTAFEAMRLGWPAYIIPFIFVYEPALLLSGDIGSILIDVPLTFLGVYFGTAALHGFARTRMGPLMRCLFAITALCLLYPSARDGLGLVLLLMGVALAIGLFGWTYMARRRETNLPRASADHAA